MKSILVGLDGSPLGERALSYARVLAHASGARLILAWVVVGGCGQGAVDVRLSEATQRLKAWAENLASQGIQTETVPAVGNMVDILAGLARHGVDLVVLTSQGCSVRRRRVRGSQVEAALARIPTSVLVVPAGAPSSQPVERPGARLLVPLDGSSFAEAALPVTVALARDLDVEVLLLDVVDLEEPASAHVAVAWELLPRSLPLTDEQLAVGYLDGVVNLLRDQGVRAARAVEEGEPALGIADAAERAGAALIVMAVHDGSVAGQRILGNVGHEVLSRARQPTLFVRPAAVRAATRRA